MKVTFPASSVNTEDLLNLEFPEDAEEHSEIGWSCDQAPINVAPFNWESWVCEWSC